MSHRAASAAVSAVVVIVVLGGCRGGRSAAPSRSPGPAVSSTPPGVAAGSATSHTTPNGPSPRHQIPPALVIHIRGYAYHPAAPNVVVGQRLQIVNDDTAAHTWSAAPGAGWRYTSGNLVKGQRATFAGFAKPGRYKFLCYYHAEMPAMNGTVTVRASS